MIHQAKKIIKAVNSDIIYRPSSIVHGPLSIVHRPSSIVNGPSSIIKGDITNVHDIMVAVEKASKSYKMMMEIRNNVIAAYREVMGARI